jgi:hypothetical protein
LLQRMLGRCYHIHALRDLARRGCARDPRRCIPQEVWMKKYLGLTLLFFIAAVILLAGVSINSSQAADATQITIVYSGNLLGYTEPCG